MGSNPVSMLTKAGYKPFREASRNRPLEDAELSRLGQALVAMEAEGYGQFCDFVRVLYFSGARRGEVLGLSWEWIDEERKVITWPDSKTGETSKPLNDAVFEVLAGIPRFKGVPWVFPSTESESGHLEDIKRPWKRLLKLSQINDLTRHDLRHNVGNQAADGGENLQTVAALLGHRQTSTSERYSKTRGLAASNRLGATLKRKLGGGE
jgi:integrase